MLQPIHNIVRSICQTPVGRYIPLVMGRHMAQHRTVKQFNIKGNKKNLKKLLKKSKKGAQVVDDSVNKVPATSLTPSVLSIQPISKKKQRKLEKITRRTQRSVEAADKKKVPAASVSDVAMDVL